MYLADPLLNEVHYLTDETNPFIYNVSRYKVFHLTYETNPLNYKVYHSTYEANILIYDLHYLKY